MNPQPEKVFTLKKPDPDYAEIVPKARRVVGWKHTLSLGARLFYAIMTDCSLWPGVNMRPGVVRYANSYLARKFGVSEKTIQNWKQELVGAGDVWLSEKWLKNSFPMTVYHITAIGGPAPVSADAESKDDLPEDEDEPISNLRRARKLARDPATGKFLGGGVKTAESPKTAVFSENGDSQHSTPKTLPSSTATNCRSERQPVAAHSGNGLPASAETDCRSERQPVAVVGGNQLPSPAATSCRGPRKPVAEKGEVRGERVETKLRGKGQPPPGSAVESAFRKWETTLDSMFPSRLERTESALKRELNEARGKEARDLAQRKLAAVRVRLLGPSTKETPARGTPATVAKPQPAPIPFEKRRELMARARKESGV